MRPLFCRLAFALATSFLFVPGVNASAQDSTSVQTNLESTFLIPESDDGLPGTGPIRRYQWMKETWQRRRSTFADNKQESRGAVVFLGDSITQGWKDDFEQDFGDLHVANRGISGDTTRGMLIRLQEDVLDLDPAGVVMLMGTNDLEEQATPETIVGNIRLIIDSLHQHNQQLPVVVCLVMPSSEVKKRPADQIKRLNELIRDAVRGDARITVLDTWTLFATKSGDAIPAEFPDLLHPNRAGYLKWKQALLPIFATLGFVETQPDWFEVEAGFTSLFNGHDLTGWEYRPTPPKMRVGRERWLGRSPKGVVWPLVESRVALDQAKQSPDGRYMARNGRLIVATPPEGRKIQQLWTTADYSQDFTLRLEFRATPNADSGVFLRQPQLQVRDYILAGPYKKLKRYRPQQWNELEVVVRDNVAHCTCNGEVIEAALKMPESGPIGLEGDRGQIEYRRIRIKTDD